VLKQRLGHEQPELVHELERKASEWFEGQGLVVEAIQHALHSSDAPRAIRLIERVGSALVLDQQVQTVLGWLGELPSAQVSERPVLCTIRALALVFSNRPDAAESSLQDAERCLTAQPTTNEAREILGRAAVIRAPAIGRPQRAASRPGFPGGDVALAGGGAGSTTQRRAHLVSRAVDSLNKSPE